jgi:hypothetical protein
MPSFDAEFKHWPTVDAFIAYLATVPRPSWCTGITNHNTDIPNEFQWHGLKSLESMRATYIGKGWSAGPHLYLAAEAPDPADTGIWQMTPLGHRGVHAGPCNTDHLGIENVGDFDARPPSPAQYDLMLCVNRAILQHWLLTPERVAVHNECMPGRTCPGRHLNPKQLRADLAAPMPAPTAVHRYLVTAPCAVLTARSPSAPLAGGSANGQTQLQPGTLINVGDVTAGWLWVSDGPTTAPGIGFIPASYARPV